MEACLPVLESTSIKETYLSLGKRWDRYADQPLTRYDMAQIIYNLVLEKDALQETIRLSTTDIADWAEIPDGCHSAVFTCWGMGLLKVLDMPAFGLQGEETVQEMMKRVNRATPLCEEGRLPNGKSRTEENIQELLELVKQGCPDGTVWSAAMRYDYRVPRLGPRQGCLSFGLAVSDFAFCEEAPSPSTGASGTLCQAR